MLDKSLQKLRGRRHPEQGTIPGCNHHSATRQIMSRMQITIKLFAGLCIGRFKEAERDYPIGFSVDNVLQSLGMSEVRGIVLVNGKPVPKVQLLNDGDTLSLFPLVSGG